MAKLRRMYKARLLNVQHIVNSTRSYLVQYDHVIRRQGGVTYELPQQNALRTKHNAGVGCDTCKTKRKGNDNA